jgi:transposase
MTLYSLRKLSKAVDVGTKTLQRWRDRGWLEPSAQVGEGRMKYTMEAFNEACKRSLGPAHEPDEPNQAVYKEIFR